MSPLRKTCIAQLSCEVRGHHRHLAKALRCFQGNACARKSRELPPGRRPVPRRPHRSQPAQSRRRSDTQTLKLPTAVDTRNACTFPLLLLQVKNRSDNELIPALRFALRISDRNAQIQLSPTATTGWTIRARWSPKSFPCRRPFRSPTRISRSSRSPVRDNAARCRRKGAIEEAERWERTADNIARRRTAR